jgi:hypothetical protein
MRLDVLLTRAVEAARHGLIYRPRYWALRARGYGSANPRFDDFRCSPETIAESIGEISARTGIERFDTVFEHRCGTGSNGRALQKIATHVYGADSIPLPFVSISIERYICISEGSRVSFPTVEDGSVDAIFHLNQIGFNARSTWSEFLQRDDRVSTLLEPQNFPRLLKPGGFLIFSEWESRPERRWGRMGLGVIVGKDASKEYDPPLLQGFELAACGFTCATRGPFVAYRRTAQIWSEFR